LEANNIQETKMIRINQRWLLNKRPEGMPEDNCWKWEEVDVPELKDGEILIKSLYLSIDPYMRGRMNDAVSYTGPVQIGDVMVGESVGIVVESKSGRFKLGDYVCVHGGWQSYIAVRGDGPELFQADPDMAPLPTYLGTVGMPGRTAYFGLTRLGKPKEGETVVVSAASGAVGTVVGQVAKIFGCRTHHRSLKTIKQKNVSISQLGGQSAHTDHGGNLTRTSHDDSMACTASTVCGYSQNLFSIQGRSIGRRKVICRQDSGFV